MDVLGILLNSTKNSNHNLWESYYRSLLDDIVLISEITRKDTMKVLNHLMNVSPSLEFTFEFCLLQCPFETYYLSLMMMIYITGIKSFN